MRLRPLYDISLPVLSSGLRYGDLCQVLPTSPQDERIAVEMIAWFFKRELHFDFIQFVASEHPSKAHFVKYVAYLFLEVAHDLLEEERPTPHRAIGAACFRHRKFEDIGECWSLDWAWVHPYSRRQGILSKHWPHFRQQHGAFHLAKPLSYAMERFVEEASNV